MYYKDRKLYERITDRLEQKKPAYDRFNVARDSINEYFRLDIGIDAEESNRGDFFGRNMYESTGPWAAKTMAKFFQGSLVSPNTDWIKYAMRQSELVGVDELDIWCQDVKDHMTSVYRRSNYYQTLPRYTLDGLTTGSPVLFVEETDPIKGTIKCLQHHYKHCFMFYDKYGDIEGIILKDPTWTARQIEQKFSNGATSEKDYAKYSTSLQNDLKQGNFNAEHTIIRAIFKYDDPLFNREGFKKPRGKKWISVYFEENGPPDRKDTPLLVEGFFTRPFMTWNYNRLEYEMVSRTPAFEAIYDVLSQQQAYKNWLENAALKNRPPRIALSTMKNRLELWPEGLTYVDDEEYQKPPHNLDVVGDVLYNKETSDILAEAIKRHFMLDALMRFSEIAKNNKQPLTVYQLWKIAGENSTLLSPAIESYSGDLLGPVDVRFVDIEYRAGRGPFDRMRMEEISEIVWANLKTYTEPFGLAPEFIGPLARAQRLQQAVEPIISGLQTLAPVFQMFPEAKYVMKQYELADRIVQATDFPLDVINTKEDFEKIIAEISQQAFQQKQFDNAIEMAKASKDVSGSVEPDSFLGAVVGAA